MTTHPVRTSEFARSVTLAQAATERRDDHHHCHPPLLLSPHDKQLRGVVLVKVYEAAVHIAVRPLDLGVRLLVMCVRKVSWGRQVSNTDSETGD